MVRHLIYIYKVPESTRRIGFFYSSDQPIYHEDLPTSLIDLTEKFELTIHHFTTDDFSIESIVQKDSFFDGIEFFTNLDAFSNNLVETVNQQSVTPLQFSQLILSKFPLDKHQIQKVLYLIYAECLMAGIKLFETPPVLLIMVQYLRMFIMSLNLNKTMFLLI